MTGFVEWDRASWANLGRGRGPAGVEPPEGSPVPFSEWDEIYVPLAHLIGLHLDARLELNRHLAAAGWRGSSDGPFIIGLGGSVAAGKSTSAEALAKLIAARPGPGLAVEVVSTDGFLFSNAELEPRGLVMRKGFPETYDDELIGSVLERLLSGEPDVEIPTYSHEVYDIAGPPQVLDRPDVLILEGVYALSPAIADFCALRLYLDVDEPDVRAWYVTRFAALVEAARDDPTSFFARWAGLGASDLSPLAVTIWESVNLENLVAHIAPSRARADVILHLGPDHATTKVSVRRR